MKQGRRCVWGCGGSAIVRVVAWAAAVSLSPAGELAFEIGPPAIVPIPTNPVYYYANDSHFPFLPNSNRTAHITFWVDGLNFRSQGRSLMTMESISPTNSVLSGTKGQFDGGGAWLVNAVRRPDGVIVGFYHAEDHSAVPRTEWNSTGVALSTDDGASFVKLGQIIGSPNPGRGNGGIAASTVLWDHLERRWLGWGGPYAFESRDKDAAPGTWRGYDTNGQFTVPMPCTDEKRLGKLPGLDGHCSSQAATWNKALGLYLMVYTRWGDESRAHLATSTNGIAWTPGRTLLEMPAGEHLAYPCLLGDTSEQCDSEALLVYQRTPPTQPGRYRDTIQRKIRFTPSRTE